MALENFLIIVSIFIIPPPRVVVKGDFRKLPVCNPSVTASPRHLPCQGRLFFLRRFLGKEATPSQPYARIRRVSSIGSSTAPFRYTRILPEAISSIRMTSLPW